MVQFFLDRGAGPNNLDGNQTISLYTLTSMHMVAARSGTAFSKQAKQWFGVAKLIILLHGASTDVICTISIKSGKVEERVNHRKLLVQIYIGTQHGQILVSGRVLEN